MLEFNSLGSLESLLVPCKQYGQLEVPFHFWD